MLGSWWWWKCSMWTRWSFMRKAVLQDRWWQSMLVIRYAVWSKSISMHHVGAEKRAMLQFSRRDMLSKGCLSEIPSSLFQWRYQMLFIQKIDLSFRKWIFLSIIPYEKSNKKRSLYWLNTKLSCRGKCPMLFKKFILRHRKKNFSIKTFLVKFSTKHKYFYFLEYSPSFCDMRCNRLVQEAQLSKSTVFRIFLFQILILRLLLHWISLYLRRTKYTSGCSLKSSTNCKLKFILIVYFSFQKEKNFMRLVFCRYGKPVAHNLRSLWV